MSICWRCHRDGRCCRDSEVGERCSHGDDGHGDVTAAVAVTGMTDTGMSQLQPTGLQQLALDAADELGSTRRPGVSTESTSGQPVKFVNFHYLGTSEQS